MLIKWFLFTVWEFEIEYYQVHSMLYIRVKTRKKSKNLSSFIWDGLIQRSTWKKNGGILSDCPNIFIEVGSTQVIFIYNGKFQIKHYTILGMMYDNATLEVYLARHKISIDCIIFIFLKFGDFFSIWAFFNINYTLLLPMYFRNRRFTTVKLDTCNIFC